MVALVGFVGGAVAHPNAGVSGNCDDGQEGGGGGVQVAENPNVVSPNEVNSIVEGLAHFGQNFDPEGSNACDGRDPGDSDEDDDDYIEAHVSGSGPFPNTGAQVCYSDGNDDTSPSEDNVNTGGHYHNVHCD